jgi:hypothetical protein
MVAAEEGSNLGGAAAVRDGPPKKSVHAQAFAPLYLRDSPALPTTQNLQRMKMHYKLVCQLEQ